MKPPKRISLKVFAKTYGILALVLALFAGIAWTETQLFQASGARREIRAAMRLDDAGTDESAMRLPPCPFAENPNFVDFKNGRR